MQNLTLILLLFIIVTGCERKEYYEKGEVGTVLCEVGSKQLFTEDLNNVIPPNISRGDSLLFIKSYVNRWLKDALILESAEKNIPPELNIEKLVSDYRESLLLLHYEQALTRTNLDSIHTRQEIENHYSENKEEYTLEESMARIVFFKPDKKTSNTTKIWDKTLSGDNTDIVTACSAEDAYCFLNPNIWLSLSEINKLLPKPVSTTKDWLKDGDIKISDGYLHIFEVAKKGEASPMELVEGEIKRKLFNKKRMELLDETREDLYEKALNDSRIKIYIE